MAKKTATNSKPEPTISDAGKSDKAPTVKKASTPRTTTATKKTAAATKAAPAGTPTKSAAATKPEVKATSTAEKKPVATTKPVVKAAEKKPPPAAKATTKAAEKKVAPTTKASTETAKKVTPPAARPAVKAAEKKAAPAAKAAAKPAVKKATKPVVKAAEKKVSPAVKAETKKVDPETSSAAPSATVPSLPGIPSATGDVNKAVEPVARPGSKSPVSKQPATNAESNTGVEGAESEPPLPADSPVVKQHPPEEERHDDHHESPVFQEPSLFVVHITPELAPIAKVGGLADVVAGLSHELAIRGNSVEIILPKYDSMRYDHVRELQVVYNDLWVPWYDSAVHCTVWFGFVDDQKCFFIEPHSDDHFFERGSIYGFDDDILRFAFFSRAAIEFLWKAGKHPDIIHCHDWQTALVPVFLYEIYQHMGMTHPRVCYTIHNFKHQGVTGEFLLHATGLNRPEYFVHYDRLLDNHTPHAINLMKGGVVYSNFVTTVSPRHSREAQEDQGFGLQPTLHTHHAKFGGVVNGVDYNVWNPEVDYLIPVNYNIETIDDKYRNKEALRQRLMLADGEKPLIAFVGRLDPQKGLELVRHALFQTLELGGQFILLGSSPDSEINSYFWSLKQQLNDSPDCHIEVGFDEELAHLIYAGADMVVVPSQFEPCGLTQLIAMRYGTVPVVRSVGGLGDTIFDKDYASDKPLNERNGYSFDTYDEGGLNSALHRAISCYFEYPDHFRDLMINGMNSDYSWNHPGQHYLNIYHHIRNR